MSPIKLRALIEAKRFAESELERRSPARKIIQELVIHFKALWIIRTRTGSLKCAQVSAQCSHMKGDRGLLNAWLKAAADQIAKETGF